MKFTSIKQIPKEAIEMIDEVRWFIVSLNGEIMVNLPERLNSDSILEICEFLRPDGSCKAYRYIEKRELEDKTYGINLYKKIHGEG